MKKTIHDGHRIEVRPDLRHPDGLRPGDPGYNEYAARVCQEIQNTILRHVDQLAPTGIGDPRPSHAAVKVIYDTREECTHCGLAPEPVTQQQLNDHPDLFTADERPGQPQCCHKAADTWRETHIPLCAYETTPGNRETPPEYCGDLSEPRSDYCAPHARKIAVLEALLLESAGYDDSEAAS